MEVLGSTFGLRLYNYNVKCQAAKHRFGVVIATLLLGFSYIKKKKKSKLKKNLFIDPQI